MPSVPEPAPALRDRAERHVFATVPELPAVERRLLALLDLAGADRAAAAAETGLDEIALRFAAKRARKALRRTSAPLSAGARCERAELLHSDRLDGPLPRAERKWLEIHLARCPRCTEHAELLADARTRLRATFAAEPPPAPASPEPPPSARLRVVPPPPPEPVGGESDRPGHFDGPRPAAQRVPEATPAPAPSTPSPVPPAAPPKRAERTRWRRVALVLAAVLALLAGVGAAVAALDHGHDQPPVAPWNQPDAPEVRPAPLVDQ